MKYESYNTFDDGLIFPATYPEKNPGSNYLKERICRFSVSVRNAVHRTAFLIIVTKMYKVNGLSSSRKNNIHRLFIHN